ncbi:MAG: hypothetical protein ACREBC_26990, partial [Pyrinomonadaceae bacterium]
GPHRAEYRGRGVIARIPMDIIHMSVEILLTADLMLPKPPLPYGTFAVFGLGAVNAMAHLNNASAQPALISLDRLE